MSAIAQHSPSPNKAHEGSEGVNVLISPFEDRHALNKASKGGPSKKGGPISSDGLGSLSVVDSERAGEYSADELHSRRSGRPRHAKESRRTSLHRAVSGEQINGTSRFKGEQEEFECTGALTDEALEVAFQASERVEEPTNLQGKTMRLSPAQIIELTSSPLSLPVPRSSVDFDDSSFPTQEQSPYSPARAATFSVSNGGLVNGDLIIFREEELSRTTIDDPTSAFESSPIIPLPSVTKDSEGKQRPHSSSRTVSTPLLRRSLSASKGSGTARDSTTSTTKQRKHTPTPLRFEDTKAANRLTAMEDPEPSPMPTSIPVPPLSLPTYLQLELSSHNPSPLYIHRSITSDFPYESSRVKIDRLLNFLFLPPQLEQVLWFGALACLDAWLYSFTILPLRFLKALSILANFWGHAIASEVRFIGAFIYAGTGRMWRRRQRANVPTSPAPKPPKEHLSDDDSDKAFVRSSGTPGIGNAIPEQKSNRRYSSIRRHRRTQSTPSALLPDHKADILKGFLIILSCIILMYFDASRMYHSIRGQAAIKLYVIYNVLEVCDRLFSALGQDVLECLFSQETLERHPNGRSKIIRPFWLFILALAYNLVHATALFYQVITLNVAVNSYSNALLTLLMSNQFVEIKSTVFKKFEKENLFQLTCADVVERFQLWLMLMIIASRNIIETGSLMPISSSSSTTTTSTGPTLLPKSFTILPSLSSLSGQVLGPFLLVLGSEMLVDWLKHAYITKFNNIKPAIYGRFLDVLCKDYYSNAFADQNLTRRLGLPVIPLACLFIRASVQTYHMFLATHMPSPLPSFSSAATSLALPSDGNNHPPASPTAAIPETLSNLLTTLLPTSLTSTYTPDALLTLLTTAVIFLLAYLTLLALKLVLGMALLQFARRRYKGMKEREGTSFYAGGRRVGGWGVVEVDDDKSRWIYEDDPEGARMMRERAREGKRAAEGGDRCGLGRVQRYTMAGKRIW